MGALHVGKSPPLPLIISPYFNPSFSRGQLASPATMITSVLLQQAKHTLSQPSLLPLPASLSLSLSFSLSLSLSLLKCTGRLQKSFSHYLTAASTGGDCSEGPTWLVVRAAWGIVFGRGGRSWTSHGKAVLICCLRPLLTVVQGPHKFLSTSSSYWCLH